MAPTLYILLAEIIYNSIMSTNHGCGEL